MHTKSLFAPFAVLGLVLVFVWAMLGAAASAATAHGDILQLQEFHPAIVEIERDGEARVVLEKSGDTWQLMAPVRDLADQQEVDNLIQRLGSLTIADVLPADLNIDFGLESPQAVVRLSDGNGERRELLIGKLRSPVSLFVQPVGSPVVYAVSNVNLARLGQHPMAFLDRTLLQIDPAAVRSIELRYAPATEEADLVHLKVDRQGATWIMSGGTIAFDVDGFLRSVKMVQAAGRLSAREGEETWFFPAAGAARIDLALEDGSVVGLDVGTVTSDGLYNYFRVAGRDEVYLLPRFQAGLIVGQALNINDSLLSIDFDAVNQIKLSIGPEGQEVIYRRNAGGMWESNRAVAFNVGPMLDAIGSIEAKSAAPATFTDEQLGFGTAQGALGIDIEFRDKNVLSLQAGAKTPDGSGVYVRTNERPGIYVGTQSGIDEVIRANAAVRTKLFPLDPAEVTRIRVVERLSADERILEVERAGDAWSSGGRTLDATAVNSLLTELGNLAADELPEPPADESALGFYPMDGSMRIQLLFSDGSERHLDVGAKVEVGSGWFATINYYVSVSDLDELTFVREQSLRRVTRAIDALR